MDATNRTTPATDREHKEREHFFGSAKVIAGLTVLSRIAGMVRAMAMAMLGANALTDAFTLAFRIPNLFRRLFAEGALSAAFVPVFTDTIEHGGGMDKARRLFANAMGLLALLMVSIMVVMELGLLVWSLWPALTGGEPAAEDTRLLILLTSIMLPFMVTICMLALASAALNCRGHFVYPAATPIILNLVIIATTYTVHYLWRESLHGQLIVISASVSVAGVVQLAGVYWLLKRSGFPISMMLKPLQEGIRPMARLMAPMLLGLGFLQVAELTETGLAWILRATAKEPTLSLFGLVLDKPLSEGILLRLGNAQFLYQFPMGVLAISLGVAVFPLLSRYAARGDMDNLRSSVNRALRLSFMESVASGVGLFVLAEPISILLFRHGNYTLADAHTTAYILRMYVTGMWAYCTYQIIVRAFYAMKDTTTPLRVSCVLAVVHLVLVAGLVWVDGLREGAFGIATATTFAINTVVLGLLLRRRLGRLGMRSMLVSFGRTALASVVMGAVLYGVLLAMEHWGVNGESKRGSGLIVAVALPAGALVFVLSAWLMRAPELSELAGPIVQRLRRGRNAEAEPK